MTTRTNRKAIAIPPKPGAEQWVRQGAEPAPPAPVSLKRLTLDLPEALHRAIKLRAVHDGTSIVEMLRALLDREYGQTP